MATIILASLLISLLIVVGWVVISYLFPGNKFHE